MTITAHVRKKLKLRDPYCLHCGEDTNLVVHHRKNRGMGGSKLLDHYTNLLMVCEDYNSRMESSEVIAEDAVISSVIVCNRSASDATYRLSVAPAGTATANSHYLAYDVTVGASDSTTLTLGLTLDATDVFRVYASTADLTFSAFGSEITA
jgi:hypothetical protein